MGNCLANLTNQPFSCLQYVRKPQVISRTICLMFTASVIGCFSLARVRNTGHCPINVDPITCNFGIGAGVVGLLILLLFLWLDAYLGRLTDMGLEKNCLVLDIIVTFVYTGLWFAGFCYILSKWSDTDRQHLEAFEVNCIKCGLAFVFLSFISWGVTCGFGIIRMRNIHVYLSAIYQPVTTEQDHFATVKPPTYLL